MIEFLNLCFPWTFYLALGLATIISVWDVIYGEKWYSTLHYPHNLKIQIISIVLSVAIFVLWQLPLGKYALNLEAEILMFRLCVLFSWMILAKILTRLTILGVLYYIYWDTFGKFPK